MEFVGHRFFIFTGCGTATGAAAAQAAHAENPFFFFFLASDLGFPVLDRPRNNACGGFRFVLGGTLKHHGGPPRETEKKKKLQSRALAWDVVGFARDLHIATTPMRASCHPERSMARGSD